jgi:diketogulonate reductase-like aldo/keto reductase
MLVAPLALHNVSVELVVLLHAPQCWAGQCSREEEAVGWRDAWRNLEHLKGRLSLGQGQGQGGAGAARRAIDAIGVSNFEAAQLRALLALARERVAVVQNWMDPFHHDKDARELCAQFRVAYMAYSSFGTQWLGRGSGRFASEEDNPVFTNPALASIATKHNASIAQVVLAWLVAQGATAIPRASSMAHIAENFNFLLTASHAQNGQGEVAGVVLDEADLDLFAQLDGILGNPWDEEL